MPVAIGPTGAPVQIAIVHSQPRSTSGLAVAAFVCSLLAVIPYTSLLLFIVTIVLARMALSEIKRDPTLGGRGLAVAALWIVNIIFVFWLLLFLTFCSGVAFLMSH
jgi:hypothetical protein